MRRLIIYSRVSTKKQATLNQIQKCQRYAKTIAKPEEEIIFFNENESTTRLPWQKRPKLAEMMEFVRKGDLVIVYSLDRIARKGTELAWLYQDKLIGNGVNVYSLMEPYIGPGQIHIHAYIAEMERDHISTKTKDALLEKQNCMEKVGQSWYGFMTDPNILNMNELARTYKKPYKLIPENSEYEACQLMIELQAKGLTYEEIALDLSSQGYKNRAGNPFHAMTVYRVLKRKDKYQLAHEEKLSFASH